MTFADTLSLISSVATAVGVGIAATQIWMGRLQGISQFEDSFAKEYRDVASKIPTRALLGSELTDEEKLNHFDELFRYYDLCNEQIFLRIQGRINRKTWDYWRDGMKFHFAKPAFRWAWSEINSAPHAEFNEFRRLIESEFKDDPRKWRG
jgi:hypothetical protein